MKTLNKKLAALQLTQAIEQLKEMHDSSLQVCHNNYCSSLGYEDRVFDNDEYNINENFSTPFELLLSMQHYNLSDDYFYFHNGNLISFNYLTEEDSPITFSELAQWLIDEDKLADYDITVTTLEDMLASIEDNISDDNAMLNKLGNFLAVNLDNDSYEDNVYDVMAELNSYSYEQLKEIITMLGITYE